MTIPPGGQGERVVNVDRDQEAWRSDAQVDVDRLLYSPEFRRLAGVTQVVPPQDDFHFHDRLSHSIKVAQVAETLARMLVHEAAAKPEFADVKLEQWVDPSHCYAAGLAHDIGHPPFGHAGEEALQKQLDRIATVLRPASGSGNTAREPDEVQDPPEESEDETGEQGNGAKLLAERSFEGNAQSTRVVAKLSVRGDERDAGLNLTLRTLAGIAKYPWQRGGHPASKSKLAKKWSFYPEEGPILDRLVTLGYVKVHTDEDATVVRVDRWVEAEIMDWADDISYAVHDVDDFYRAGLIPLGQIVTTFKAAPARVNWNTTDFDFVDDDSIRDCLLYISDKLKRFDQGPGVTAGVQEQRISAAFEQIRVFAGNVGPEAPFSGSRRSHIDLHRFGSAVIVYLSGAAALSIDSHTARVQLDLEPTRVLVAEFFKALNGYFVIESVSLAAMQYGQAQNLTDLFLAMFDMASELMNMHAGGPISGRLPARLRSYLMAVLEDRRGAKVGDGDIAIAVLDYITSLRDVQAAHLAAQLTGSRETPALAGNWLNT